MTPQIVATGEVGPSPAAAEFMMAWTERVKLAKAHLEGAAERAKKWADKKRRDEEFQVGEKVLLRLSKEQFVPPKGLASSLVRKYDGPFEILEKVGKVAYRLRLPEHLQAYHPVFHVSQLKRCRVDADEPERHVPTRAPAMIVDRPDREVEAILGHRFNRRGKDSRLEYFVKWRDLPEEENSWEWKNVLWKAEDLVRAFQEEHGLPPRRNPRKSRRRDGDKLGGGACHSPTATTT